MQLLGEVQVNQICEAAYYPDPLYSYYTNDTAIYRWEGWGENFRAYKTDLSYDEMINHNQNYRAALQMKTEDANGFCHSDLLG